ncbi:MAG: ABC transporter permease subunit [Opitutaceae bacterium]
MKKSSSLPLLTAALLAVCSTPAATPASVQMLINGAGSTFDYPAFTEWFEAYQQVDADVRFNYQSIGSGVILGRWGIFVMILFLRADLLPWLQRWFGFLPLFHGPIYGVSMLAGEIIIAIMCVPIITSISREILRSVPGLQREAAYALGATRWEVTRVAVLGNAKKGLFGAVILGLGRALGETMAVTMVIGNTPQIVASLFAPGYTLASVVANEFTEATGRPYLSALFELGLVLLAVTVLVNIVAQVLLKTFAGPTLKPSQ